MENLSKMADKAIRAVDPNFDPSSDQPPASYVEAHLKEQHQAEEGSSFHGEIGKLNLNGAVQDFFAAGSFTVVHTLQWVSAKLEFMPVCDVLKTFIFYQ